MNIPDVSLLMKMIAEQESQNKQYNDDLPAAIIGSNYIAYQKSHYN